MSYAEDMEHNQRAKSAPNHTIPSYENCDLREVSKIKNVWITSYFKSNTGTVFEISTGHDRTFLPNDETQWSYLLKELTCHFEFLHADRQTSMKGQVTNFDKF